MVRVYFHLINSIGSVPDDEGREVSEIGAARGQAMKEIRSMLSEEVKQGRMDLRGRIEIRDGAANLLDVVRFVETVDLVLEPPLP